MDLILIIIILVLLFGGPFRLSPMGIWWRHRYRRYSVDRAHGLFIVRTRRIVIFRNYVADTRNRYLICPALIVLAHFELNSWSHWTSQGR